MFEYAKLTLKHKWYVFQAGLKTKAPLFRLVIHDWTKFLPCEYFAYQRQFFGKSDRPHEFISAWLHHQNANPHHWEYWIPRSGHSKCNPPYPNNQPIDMPEWAIREMIADWIGAYKAYDPKNSWPIKNQWEWLDKNLEKINVTTNTRIKIKEILTDLNLY